MRSTMIGNLVANVRYNLNRKFSRIRLFEIGAVFLQNSEVKDGPASVAGSVSYTHLDVYKRQRQNRIAILDHDGST